MSEYRVPAEPVHLAEIIEDEMRERGWSMDDLVMNMGPFYTEKAWGICKLSWEMFFAVRTTDVALGDEMAMELSAAFDVSPKFFLALHKVWRDATIRSATHTATEDLSDTVEVGK